MRVLRTPGFGRLLVGQSVNAVGNWVALIAIWGFASFRFDATAADLALLFVVLAVPGAVLGPLLGVVIDRIGPRRSLMVANGLGVANALALTQADSYLAIIALALPLGLIEGMASASIDAIPPRLVADSDLVRANALLGAAQDLAIVVGPVLAAAVNLRWGLAGAFLADAATFAVGLVSVVGLHLHAGDQDPGDQDPGDLKPEPPATEAIPAGMLSGVAALDLTVSRRAWAGTVEGLALARHSPRLRWLLGVTLLTVAVWSLFSVIEPLYVRDVLGASDTTFAIVQAVFGVGMVGTGGVMAVVGDRVARPGVIAAATVASGVSAGMYVSTESLAVAYVGVGLWGVSTALVLVPTKTLLQRASPTSAHGRVLAINESLEPLSDVLVTPMGAVLAGVVGVQVLGVVGGAVMVVGGWWALRSAQRFSDPG